MNLLNKGMILCLLTLLLSVSTSQAETTEDGNMFLAIPATASLAKQTQELTTEKLVTSYVNSQLQANNISTQEYLSLTPEDQQKVLIPGTNFHVSREERRTFVPLKQGVPNQVITQANVGAEISEEVLSRYAVRLPASLVLSLPDVSTNRQPVLLGNNLLFLNSNRVVTDLIKNVF